jgi:hypothetical protein
MKLYLSPTKEIFAYELDGSQDHLIPKNYTAITESQARKLREDKNTEYLNSLTYREKRASEYPSFNQQFDLLYHGGYDLWKAEIKKIKDKYPKS